MRVGGLEAKGTHVGRYAACMILAWGFGSPSQTRAVDGVVHVDCENGRDSPEFEGRPSTAFRTLGYALSRVDAAGLAEVEILLSPCTYGDLPAGGEELFPVVVPARLRKLVLVGTSPRFVADESWPHAMAPEMLARFADELRVAWQLTLQRFLSLQVRGSEAGHATLAALRHQLFARGKPDPAMLCAALGALAGADLRADAARIPIPTLVVAGEHDTLAPPAASAWLAEALPAAELLRLPGAGHAPFLSHPDAFRDALLGFLADE